MGDVSGATYLVSGANIGDYATISGAFVDKTIKDYDRLVVIPSANGQQIDILRISVEADA